MWQRVSGGLAVNTATAAKGTEAEESKYTEVVSSFLMGSRTEEVMQCWAMSYLTKLPVAKRNTKGSVTTQHPQTGRGGGKSAGKAEKGSYHWKCSCRQRKPQSQLLWNRGRFCFREETTKWFEGCQENGKIVYLKFRWQGWLRKLKMLREAFKM